MNDNKDLIERNEEEPSGNGKSVRFNGLGMSMEVEESAKENNSNHTVNINNGISDSHSSKKQNNRVVEENNLGVFSFLSFIVSAIFVGIGFHKIFAYENVDAEEYEYLAEDNVNSYVGGDAYNFIINANYATGYFVLATLFVIIACTLLIIKELRNNTN
ncbi:hypothetical protein M9R32_15160 [Paenisporosarcina quisquiliarum]|uniref:Uncharacterized protein n=1 Tax=Paenisporosarcina quisquiliarum TaxID=365346 RepID=A0A9X3RFC6_9BACL|nr:hypothetical protein [Paenisporosarcina quisquiliarum]MCZ8538532.1 hypothetical protein [Paenisporosarcina quisquiliarum]